MPIGPAPARYRPGARTIPAARLNASAALLERLGHFRGRATVWTPFGPAARPDAPMIRLGMTGQGGIDARDSAGVHGALITDLALVFDDSNPLLMMLQTREGSQFAGFNLSSQPVAGNVVTIYSWMWSAWICTWEDCPSSQGSQ